jgi:hypothetical protein
MIRNKNSPRSLENCGLHPLNHTFPTKSSAPDGGKKKSGAIDSASGCLGNEYISLKAV